MAGGRWWFKSGEARRQRTPPAGRWRSTGAGYAVGATEHNVSAKWGCGEEVGGEVASNLGGGDEAGGGRGSWGR